MDCIWFSTGSGKGEEFAIRRSGVLVIHARKELQAATGTRKDVILEVGPGEEIESICDLMPDIPDSCRVVVYYPEAVVSSVVCLMKAGAGQVATSFAEVEEFLDAQNCCPAISRKLLVGSSRALKEIAGTIELVANRRCTVLIEGETGTGKEVVAREIHQSGNRSRGPWIPVNCAAIPETLLEAELFGHVKGAFTGAMQARMGKFEAANKGTLFLDEIGEMPLGVQAKLLRVLQEKEIERLGGNERVTVDVRIIAATNRDLRDRVRAGLFREDLFYRLNVFALRLPPLRERREDIPVLARHFIRKICAAEGIAAKTLDPAAGDRLMAYHWPGNARELENVIEAAIILSGSSTSIDFRAIRLKSGSETAEEKAERSLGIAIPLDGLDYQQALETFELDLLKQAITRTRGNKTAAASILRLKRTTLSARMRVLEARLPSLVA